MVTIRRIQTDDASRVCKLSGQLGYPMPEPTLSDRIANILDREEHAAFVAEQDGLVVGWIHVYVTHILESPNSYVEIGGLVVDENVRGQGIGKALVRVGEQWSLENGFNDIRVRSASKRAEAHAFYEKLGYRLVKTQMRFEKSLTSS